MIIALLLQINTSGFACPGILLDMVLLLGFSILI